MTVNPQYSLTFDCVLSEEEFYSKLIDYFEKNSISCSIPSWLALKINEYGDSGISKGEMESRVRRQKFSNFGFPISQSKISLLNISGFQTLLGSYNFPFSVAKTNNGYEINGKVELVPNINMMFISPIIGFIASLIIFSNITIVLISTIGFPLLYFIFSRLKLSSAVELQRKRIEDIFTGFKGSI